MRKVESKVGASSSATFFFFFSAAPLREEEGREAVFLGAIRTRGRKGVESLHTRREGDAHKRLKRVWRRGWTFLVGVSSEERQGTL